MKKKHFLFTSLTIAAILSANVAQAEELTGPVTDPSQELVDNENQDSSPQPHQEGDLAINTRSASPTEEPAFPLGDPNQPGVEVTIDRQLNQTAVREEALTAMRELREEMWDLNPWFDGKKLQDAVKAAGFQGKADYAQALEWDNELEAYAVQRSVEVSYVWDHKRPDGSDALDTAPEKVHGENLSMGYPTVTAAIKQSWGYGELDALNATQGFLSKQGQKVNGHLHNQLNPRFKSFGVGASEKHYAQSLSFSASEQTDGLKFDGKHTIKLKVTEELAKHEDFVIKTPKNEEFKKEEPKNEKPKKEEPKPEESTPKQPQGQENNQQPPAPQNQEDNQQPPAPQSQEDNQQPPAPQTQTGMDIEAIKNGDYSSIQGVWLLTERNRPSDRYFIRITEHGPGHEDMSFKDVKFGDERTSENLIWGRKLDSNQNLMDYIGIRNSDGYMYSYIPKGGIYTTRDTQGDTTHTATEDLIIGRGIGIQDIYKRHIASDTSDIRHFHVMAGNYGMGILGDQKGNSQLDNLPVFISGRVGDTIDLNTVTKHFRSEGDKIYRVTLSNRKDSMTLPDYQSSFTLTEQLKQYDRISIAYETPFVLKDKEQKQPHSPAPQGQGNGKQTPAPQADLSTRRNQLLLELDKSPLTDEQKGQLAEKFAFANTEKELADVTAEFKRLTAALGQDSKPQTPQAPQKADAKATLPATGEAKPAVLATIGAGLLLASLGLVYHRKRSE